MVKIIAGMCQLFGYCIRGGNHSKTFFSEMIIVTKVTGT